MALVIVSPEPATGRINILRGDTLSLQFLGLGDLYGYTAIDFTVKAPGEDYTDDEAVLRIRTDDGLVRLNGAAPDDPADGEIVIDEEETGDITVTLQASQAATLTAGQYVYDVQVALTGPDFTTLISTRTAGDLFIGRDVLRAVS